MRDNEDGRPASSPRPKRRQAPQLAQDPHRQRDSPDKALEMAIGQEVRAIRQTLGLTVADLSAASGISVGMLSKIENGVTSPSLTTLRALGAALSTPVTTFFRRFEDGREARHLGAGDEITVDRRSTRAGPQYRLLGHVAFTGAGVVVEPYLISLTTETDVFPTFQHAGTELLFMLEGEVTFRHGDRLFHLQPGDSLLFDADARHGPEKLIILPVRLLAVITYLQG